MEGLSEGIISQCGSGCLTQTTLIVRMNLTFDCLSLFQLPIAYLFSHKLNKTTNEQTDKQSPPKTLCSLLLLHSFHACYNQKPTYLPVILLCSVVRRTLLFV